MEVFQFNSMIFTILNRRLRYAGIGNGISKGLAIDKSFNGKLIIPSFATYKNTKYLVTEILPYAFQQCSITEAYIPSSITKIGNYAFYKCNNNSKITFEESSSLAYIGTYAFYDNYALGNINLPSNCIDEIGSCAFQYCHLVKKVYLGSGRKIGGYAFTGLASLIDFYFCGTTQITNDIFIFEPRASWNVPENINIHTTNAYSGNLGLRPVTDNNYVCPSNTCIKNYNIMHTCKSKSSPNSVLFVLIILQS